MLNFKDCLSWIYMHTELATIDQLSFDENACRSVSESKQQQYNFDKYAELFQTRHPDMVGRLRAMDSMQSSIVSVYSLWSIKTAMS